MGNALLFVERMHTLSPLHTLASKRRIKTGCRCSCRAVTNAAALVQKRVIFTSVAGRLAWLIGLFIATALAIFVVGTLAFGPCSLVFVVNASKG